jgi:hypothetical protein
MKLVFEPTAAGLTVRIEDVPGREEALADAIRLCSGSAWACQSGECMNIETITSRARQGAVELSLVARSGATLSPAGIESCLRYMLPDLIKP